MENDEADFGPGGSTFKIKSTEIEPFPFFRLPFEIRLLCYQYLIPDITISSYPVPSRFSTPETPTEIRADKQICTPGILAVSKRVHDEVIDEFYGRGQFELTVVKRGDLTFDFLGRGHFFDDENLPRVYYLVRNLKLTIKIKTCPSGEAGDQISRIYLQCFFHLKQTALETVHIEIVNQGTFWSEHLRDPTRLGNTIAGYLGPLKAVRGMKRVTVLQNIEMPNEWETSGLGLDNDLMASRRDKILSEVQNALDEVKCLMVLPNHPSLSGQSI